MKLGLTREFPVLHPEFDHFTRFAWFCFYQAGMSNCSVLVPASRPTRLTAISFNPAIADDQRGHIDRDPFRAGESS